MVRRQVEWIEMLAGVGGMDSNFAGTGGDGTEILSLCRPLDPMQSLNAVKQKYLKDLGLTSAATLDLTH